MLVGSNVVGIGLAALTLTVNEVVLVGSYVVGIGLAALTLTVNEVVLVGSYVVGIGLTTLALTVDEVVLVRSYVVGVFCTAGTLAIGEIVAESFALGCTALTGSGIGAGRIIKCVNVFVACSEKRVKTGDLTYNALETLAGSEGEYEHAKHKNKQRGFFKVSHWFDILSFLLFFAPSYYTIISQKSKPKSDGFNSQINNGKFMQNATLKSLSTLKGCKAQIKFLKTRKKASHGRDHPQREAFVLFNLISRSAWNYFFTALINIKPMRISPTVQPLSIQ